MLMDGVIAVRDRAALSMPMRDAAPGGLLIMLSESPQLRTRALDSEKFEPSGVQAAAFERRIPQWS